MGALVSPGQADEVAAVEARRALAGLVVAAVRAGARPAPLPSLHARPRLRVVVSR